MISVTGGARWQTEEKDAHIYQSVKVPGFSLVSANLLQAGAGFQHLVAEAMALAHQQDPVRGQRARVDQRSLGEYVVLW